MHPLSIMRHPQIFFIEKRPYSNERPYSVLVVTLLEYIDIKINCLP